MDFGIPFSDGQCADESYVRLGWRLDVTPPGIVQLTPHGSGCSVQFGASRPAGHMAALPGPPIGQALRRAR